MYPHQPDPNRPQGNNPPQSPPPPPAHDGYSQSANPTPSQPPIAPPQSQPWLGQPQMQPGQNYTPMHNYSPMQQPQGGAPAGWYTPPPSAAANSDKPASVDSYLSQATNKQSSSAPAGQRINGQYAVDYLGGIAPTDTSGTISIAGKRLSKKVLFIGVGGAAALLLAGALLLFSPKQQASTTLNHSTLYVSMVDTAAVTKDSSKKIKDSKLRALNSSLTALLNGSAKQMEEPLIESGAAPSKLNASAKKPPYKDEKLRAKLEDARLLGTYDRVYIREIDHKVDTMLITMQRLKKNNSRASMQKFVDSNIPKYEDLLKSLQELDEGTD